MGEHHCTLTRGDVTGDRVHQRLFIYRAKLPLLGVPSPYSLRPCESGLGADRQCGGLTYNAATRGKIYINMEQHATHTRASGGRHGVKYHIGNDRSVREFASTHPRVAAPSRLLTSAQARSAHLEGGGRGCIPSTWLRLRGTSWHYQPRGKPLVLFHLRQRLCSQSRPPLQCLG